MYWKFYDTNHYGDQFEERAYAGEDYKNLIEACFKYCATLSFKIMDTNIKNLDKFERFRISQPANITESPQGCALSLYRECYDITNRTYIYPSLRFYKLCPEVLELMLDTASDMFEWLDGWGYKNPEDIAFYRADGSVFLESIIHDGYFYLFPREDEDVSAVLSNPLWYCFDDDGRIIKMGE